MYQTARKIHLWVGLVLAIVLLIEAITGLILAEPWVVGQEKMHPSPASFRQNIEQGKAPGVEGSAPPSAAQGDRPAQSEFSVFGFAKGLHQGKVGGLDLKWIVDFSAIGLIILTLTGVYISIPILQAGNKRR